jgi:hypothetical protein
MRGGRGAESELVCVVHVPRMHASQVVHKMCRIVSVDGVAAPCEHHDWPMETGGVERESTARYAIGPARIEFTS